MKRRHIVGVREVLVRFFTVEAENQDEAKELVNARAAQVTDLEVLEYSHELNRDTWSVEESTREQKPNS